MKAYTDLSQSKKLAEILPLESADLMWEYEPHKDTFRNKPTIIPNDSYIFINDIPCWSLAALLDFLESEIDGDEGETYQLNIEKDGTWWNVWYREQYDEANPIETESTEDLIDACYGLILKLHEMNLL